jgi:hypothetical protein
MPLSFEEKLSTWIWKQICYRTDKRHSALKTQSATTLLGEYLEEASKEEIALVGDDCSDFIISYGITHYVSAITLGASEHAVVTKSESSMLMKQGFNVSATSAASVQQSVDMKSASSKFASTAKYFGRIVDGRARRGSGNEAVIEVKILPIYSLIHYNWFIYLSMHEAIAAYTEKNTIRRGKYKAGMFQY